MPVGTIAILSPGEMGGAVGGALSRSGFQVITSLEGRSERSRQSAQRHGIRDVGGYDALVRAADLVLSILVPAEAVAVATRTAEAMRSAKRGIYYADCNAVAPATVQAMAKIVESAGGNFIDGGIIGGPPRAGYAPRFYASGKSAHVLAELSGKGIEVVTVGDEIGKASAVKMCYGALTKGTIALQVSLLIAAARLGVYDDLAAEFRHSQADAMKRIEGQIGRLPTVAHRWIGEMEEIASMFEAVRLPGNFHYGSAELFRMVAGSPLAQPGVARPSLNEAVGTLAKS